MFIDKISLEIFQTFFEKAGTAKKEAAVAPTIKKDYSFVGSNDVDEDENETSNLTFDEEEIDNSLQPHQVRRQHQVRQQHQALQQHQAQQPQQVRQVQLPMVTTTKRKSLIPKTTEHSHSKVKNYTATVKNTPVNLKADYTKKANFLKENQTDSDIKTV